jgi:hypothetical protein
MALTKIKTESPDKVLKGANYNEAQLARVAHVNEIVDQFSDLAKLIPTFNSGDTTTQRLTALEATLTALKTALA